MTIKVLKDLLINNTKYSNLEFSDFCFADTSILVSHPEPQQVITAVRRLLRDEAFRNRGILDLDKKNAERLNKNFQKLRESVFQKITEMINNFGSIRHRICQAWWGEIRKKAIDQDRLVKNMIKLRTVNWKRHKSDHEICNDLVQSDTKFSNLVESLVRHCPLGDFWVTRLRDSNVSKEERLQLAAFLAFRYAHYLPQAALLRDPYLFHFIRISFLYIGIAHKLEIFGPSHRYRSFLQDWEHNQHNIQYNWETGDRAKFSKEFLPFNLDDPFDLGQSGNQEEYRSNVVTEMLNKALESVGEKRLSGLNSWKPIDSDRSLSAFAKEGNFIVTKGAQGNRELFIRYFPVIGASRFAPISPRRQIYLQVLGEKIFDTVLGADHVIHSLYPSLTRSFLSYLGPGKKHPYEIMLDSIIIQEGIHATNMTLLSFIWFREFSKVVDAYAELLAKLHGRTLGVFKRREPERWEGLIEWQKILVKTLWEHQDQLRLFSSDVYNQWISSRGNFATRVRRLLDSGIEDGNLFANVRKVVHANGYVLSNLWNNLSEDSTEFYKKAAAIGHLYLSFDNMLVSIDHINGREVDIHETDTSYRNFFSIKRSRKGYRFKYLDAELRDSVTLKLYRFDWVFFIDPAYEFGKSLSYVFRHFLNQLRAIRDHTNLFPGDVTIGDPFHWLVSIRQRFQEKYQAKLREIICSNNGNNPESWPGITWEEIGCKNEDDVSIMVSKLVYRGLRYAGFRLLDEFAGSREFDHTFDVRQALEKLIIDLLQFGLKMTIHYPDGAV
ncbi:MAG: hypothetical protein JSV88_02620 [Candidatus Aminicenantes bacterium]|nr:MAG: hypothetical protein JSV88_02620 [Candidatus Aminicenantes bacterium]